MNKDLNKIYTLCEQLNTAFINGTAFQAKITVFYQAGNFRFDLIFPGSFSAKDLKAIDSIAREQDCYYEIGGGNVNFTLSLPYNFSQASDQTRANLTTKGE